MKLDLTYASDVKVAMIGSAFFIGWAFTLLWVPQFGDRFGRKPCYMISVFTDFIILVCIMFTHSIDFMIVCLLIFGMMASVRTNIGFPYLLEMFPESGQVLASTLWNS